MSIDWIEFLINRYLFDYNYAQMNFVNSLKPFYIYLLIKNVNIYKMFYRKYIL